MNSIKQIRDNLSEEFVIKFLEDHYGADVRANSANYIAFPTICHNEDPTTASPKLLYYKDSHMFRCFTECSASFDIFDLIQRAEKTRGREVSVGDAISMLGYDAAMIRVNNRPSHTKLLDKYNEGPDVEEEELMGYSENCLLKMHFNKDVLNLWYKENISYEVMQEFGIMYDPIQNAIAIPYYHIDERLVGVRGRMLEENSKNKYMPLKYSGMFLTHPIGRTLYGLRENQNQIRKTKTVIIFEGEKSVLKFNTLYGNSSIAVASGGQNITDHQFKLLLELGVQNIIIAFDRDWTDEDTKHELLDKYKTIGKKFSNFVSTYILFDYDGNLGHKDSPIDKGKAVFDDLYKYKIQI